ncbi:hypothetical protein VitviT2T_014868 [Vitis vinifera]|uniref:Uncharacterized protein n=2 Tax=Vitis vinifera TaxID=29760 RepID=A0ABY9CLP8_VITVI|nr:protein DESIGUAL 2 [Vitis vinifera]WJZ96156.1 hypothetical protein VitviT2T_014868 [Vitis vinifera]|eukprot:XP_002269935.2 PREDICTED: uncharacterized protein LOC100247731 [Vitis vinifera]
MSRLEKLHKDLGPILCILIMVLDIVAGILAIEAEKAQHKVTHARLWIFECRSPSHKSYNLGLAASIFLIMGQVTANLLGGCIYIRSKKELEEATANKKLAMGSLIFAWIILAVAFSCLIIGTTANSKSKKSCTILHTHFLSIGGVLCFIHALFSVAYYVSAAAVAREERKQHHPQAASASV